MSVLQLQFDDLRECRQAWAAYEESRRDEDQYRRDEWIGYRDSTAPRGVIQTDISED